MTVKCLYCNTEQKKYYGLWYCPKCENLPNYYKIMVELAKKEVFDDVDKFHKKYDFWMTNSKIDKAYKELKKRHLSTFSKKKETNSRKKIDYL